MGEPRCSLKNMQTKRYLTCRDDWSGGLSDSNGINGSFKLQWCKRGNNGVVTSILIRTDCHPQSLLDVRTLQFEGGTWDSNKCYKEERWWDIVPMNIVGEEHDIRFIVALKSASTGEYLVDDGNKLTLNKLDKSANIEKVPDMFKWEVSVSGRALSPGQVSMIAFSPVVVAAGAVSGGALGFGFAAAFGTVAGTSGATAALTIGTVVGGFGAVGGATAGILKEVSEKLFVDW